ncbi:hypothetical protein BDFB_010186, partial [Asbolus verrucosus]
IERRPDPPPVRVHRGGGRPAADELRERPAQHTQVGLLDEHLRLERNRQQRRNYLFRIIPGISTFRERCNRKQRILRGPEHLGPGSPVRHQRLLPPGPGERRGRRLHEPPQTEPGRGPQPGLGPEPLRLAEGRFGEPERGSASPLEREASGVDPGRGGAEVHELRRQLHRGEKETSLQELREGLLCENKSEEV